MRDTVRSILLSPLVRALTVAIVPLLALTLACPAWSDVSIIEDFDDPVGPGDWLFSGNATQDLANGWLELTPAANDQRGSAFMTQTIDSAAFRTTFRFFIGNGDGADGMVFGWVRTPGMGDGGSSLGWYGGGFSGYGIVFDTYPNPSVNLVSFEDPEVHTGYDSGGFISYTPPIDMENAGWFDVEIVMDNGHLEMWMSNEAQGFPKTLAIDYTVAGYTPFDAYFGFTAATGGLTNLHAVDDLALRVDEGAQAPVPEASTLMLFGSGIPGLVLWARSRKKRVARGVTQRTP